MFAIKIMLIFSENNFLSLMHALFSDGHVTFGEDYMTTVWRQNYAPRLPIKS